MEIFQIKSKSGSKYIIFRFYDNHNKNYEYEIYKAVKSKDAARAFGVPDNIDGRESNLNSREMCNRLIEKIKNNEI